MPACLELSREPGIAGGEIRRAEDESAGANASERAEGHAVGGRAHGYRRLDRGAGDTDVFSVGADPCGCDDGAARVAQRHPERLGAGLR